MIAAGRISSVPSWTRLGTGVNVLLQQLVQDLPFLPWVPLMNVRCRFVGLDVVIGLVGGRGSRHSGRRRGRSALPTPGSNP